MDPNLIPLPGSGGIITATYNYFATIGSEDMTLYIMATLIYLALILAVDAFSHSISISHGHGYNVSHPANLTANGTLLMAYHRSVAAGAAWVMPASPFDLGARAMTCECFDPDGECLQTMSFTPATESAGL